MTSQPQPGARREPVALANLPDELRAMAVVATVPDEAPPISRIGAKPTEFAAFRPARRARGEPRISRHFEAV